MLGWNYMERGMTRQGRQPRQALSLNTYMEELSVDYCLTCLPCLIVCNYYEKLQKNRNIYILLILIIITMKGVRQAQVVNCKILMVLSPFFIL